MYAIIILISKVFNNKILKAGGRAGPRVLEISMIHQPVDPSIAPRLFRLYYYPRISFAK